MNVNARNNNIHHHNQQQQQQQQQHQHHQAQHHHHHHSSGAQPHQQQRHSNVNNNTGHLNHNHGPGGGGGGGGNAAHHQVHSAPNRGAAQHANNMNGGVNRNSNRPHHALQGGNVHSSNNNHHAQSMPSQRQTQPPSQQQHQQQRMNQANRPGGGVGGGQSATAPNANAQAAPTNNSNMPPPPQVLPKGWKKEEVVRTRGISAGVVDVVYAPSPASEASNPALVGKKFRNKLELHRFLGDKYDMSLLDYKSGKVSQIAWRKQRRLKNMATNMASACKYDNYLNLPVRQTASIFKQPVSVVTNNHKNDPTPAHVLNANAPAQTGNQNVKPSEKPKPVQLFWELRFNDLKAIDPYLLMDESDSIQSIQKELELTKISKFKNFETSNETALRSVAVSCYLNPNKILIGQDKDFSKNARVFIDRDQPLIPAVSIKEEDIKLQEAKLKEIRKKIKLAIEDLENMDLEEYFLENSKIENEQMSDIKTSLVKNGIKIDGDFNGEIIIEEDDDEDYVKVELKTETKQEIINDNNLIVINN